MFAQPVIRIRASLAPMAVALLLFVIATASVPALGAQAGDTVQSRGDNRRGGSNNRAMVERADEVIDKILREKLQLTDDQSVKLRALGKKMDIARLALRKDERAFRESLRQELLPGATPNDAKISELMNRWPSLERKRIALQEREQREMASFLQPVQRARFFALQDEMRRMMQEAQWRRGDRDGEGRGKMTRPDSTGGGPPFRGGRGGRGGRVPPRDTTKPPQ